MRLCKVAFARLTFRERSLPLNPTTLNPKQTSLEAAVEAHGHVLVMFTTPWCGKCRQTGSNFKWAAEQLEGVEGVGGKTVLLAFLDLDKARP